MNVAIELPEDIAELLQQKWGDLSLHTLETLAVESYRTGLLSRAQLRRMLGFETRMEVDVLLKHHGVYLDYTEQDLETSRELRAK
jgi:chromosome segregation and condensation protein ScpB